MKKTLRFLIAFSVMAVIIVGGLMLLRHPLRPAAGNRLKIVAAENFWGDIAAQIGGDRVNVTSIISDPSTDPHLYESSASNAAAVSEADIVIQNGLGYDDFMNKLTAAAPAGKRVIINAAEASNTDSDDNPHIWYNAAKVQLVAEQIRSALAAKDAAHASEFKRNLQNFNAGMKQVSDAEAKVAAKFTGTAVAFTERVSEYMVLDAGLTVATPAGFAQAVESGNDPSPADTAAMASLISRHAIKVLLYNAQAASPTTQHIQDLARQAGLPVVAMTETMPVGATNFQSWQLQQINDLEAALNGR